MKEVPREVRVPTSPTQRRFRSDPMGGDQLLPGVVIWICALNGMMAGAATVFDEAFESVVSFLTLWVFSTMAVGSVVAFMSYGFCSMCGGRSSVWIALGLGVLVGSLMVWRIASAM